MPDLKTTLTEARTIAVVGCSDRPSRTSYAIARYLQEVGYRIIPVNPNITMCHGDQAYPDFQSLPDDVRVYIVDFFRNPAYTAEMVESAVAYAEASGTTRQWRRCAARRCRCYREVWARSPPPSGWPAVELW